MAGVIFTHPQDKSLRGQEGHQAGRSGVCEGVAYCSSWGKEALT